MQSVKQIAVSNNVVETKKDRAIELYNAGKLEEARELNLEALHEATDEDMRFILTFNWSMIERAMGNPKGALSILHLAAPMNDSCRSHALKAKYHNMLGITYQMLGYADKGLIEYEAARYHYEQAHNFIGLFKVENNVTFLLTSINRFDDAFDRLDKAKNYFKLNGEPAIAAQVDCTIAEAYQKLGDTDSALDYAMASLTELRRLGEVQAAKKSKETLKKILNDEG